MMTAYKLIKFDGKDCAVLKDGKDSIPFDPANRDYTEYLEWLSLGNTPIPADEPTLPE